MPAHRWKFRDPIEDELHEIEMNPESGGSPSSDSQVVYEAPVGPPDNDGNTAYVTWVGSPPPETTQVAGTILTEAHYRSMRKWARKRTIIEIEDDLGRTMYVRFGKLDLRRERSINFPWKHKFTLDYTILREVLPDA